MSRPECLAVVGTMGVGKTTLAEKIAQEWGHALYKERPEACPFLSGQYQDRERYAFQTQIWFLMDIYEQIRESQKNGSNTVFDAWITQYAYSYAPTLLSPDELTQYNKLYTELKKNIREPSLLISLQAKLSVILHRCRERERGYEEKVDIHYLKALDTKNNAWIKASTVPKVVIQIDELDIVHRPTALQQILSQIDKARHAI